MKKKDTYIASRNSVFRLTAHTFLLTKYLLYNSWIPGKTGQKTGSTLASVPGNAPGSRHSYNNV